MSTSEHWWDGPLRVLDFNYLIEVDTYDFRELVRTCRELHANVVHFHPATVSGGWDEDTLYFRSRVATKTNRDILGEALPLLREAGIRVVVYTDGHWYPKRLMDQHPDWWVLREDGSRVENLYGDNDAPGCVNSPWRDWAFTVLEDLLAYEVDGIFWDGPLTYLGRKACYCESCRAKYRERHGREMPSCKRENREDWQSLTEFSITSLREFYRDAYELVKRVRPQTAMYANSANVGEPSWLVGRHNRPMMPCQDVLLSEGGFMYGRVNDKMLKTTASAKLYETQAGGKPCINAVSPAFGGWRPYHLSAPEMRVLLAEASFGSNPYAAMWLESGRSPAYMGIADTYGFLERNEQYYRGTRPAANIALLHSQHTVDTYTGLDIAYCDISGIRAQPSQAIGNFSRAFNGFQEMLERLRVPFHVIDEEVLLSDALSAYDTVVLPNCACLSDAECEALRAFVTRGGAIIADFEASHFDDTGLRRSDFGLADVFGTRSADETYGPRRWDFVHTGDAVPGLFDAVTQAFMPAPAYTLRVSATTARCAAVFGEPQISNITTAYDASEEPFLLVNRFGEGASYYFACTFGQSYDERHIDAYGEVLKGILDREIVPVVEVTGPPHVLNVSVRAQEEDTLLVQLVNYELRPVNEVIPAHDVTVRVRTKKPVTGVTALRAGTTLDFTPTDDGATFVLPLLTEFDVLAVKTA